MENTNNKKSYILFLEQDPTKSEFFASVQTAAFDNELELIVAGTVEEAKEKITELSKEDKSLVAVMSPILYPDIINVIKTIPQIDPFAQLIFLFAKDEEDIAKNVISSYMLVGVERRLAEPSADELAPILNQAIKVVSQRRRQRTSLEK